MRHALHFLLWFLPFPLAAQGVLVAPHAVFIGATVSPTPTQAAGSYTAIATLTLAYF